MSQILPGFLPPYCALLIDAGEPGRTAVKTIVIKRPDRSASDIPICGEKEERGPGFFGHSITAFAPMLPADQMGFAQEKAEK